MNGHLLIEVFVKCLGHTLSECPKQLKEVVRKGSNGGTTSSN